MSLHNQESQHVTNKASSSLFVNQSTAGAVSMAKQIAKGAAPSNPNKYSTLNINYQFKGKGIEPQHKAAVLRPAPTGMQTLGKAVAARRMPPPTHLPSLRTFNSTPTQSVESVSNEISSGSQNGSSQSVAPTIAAVVSGSPWTHDSNSSVSVEPNARSLNKNNSINQEDFPKLDEAVQQNAAKCKAEQTQEATGSDEPVFKPANLGNWSARTPVQTADEQQPSEAPSPSPQPHLHSRPHSQHRTGKFQPSAQNSRNYPAELRHDEFRRPFLYNKNDSRAETNKENVTDPNKIDFSNLDENNWAMISDRVDYDEKLDFDDQEEGEKGLDNGRHEFQVDFEEQKWEDKRKEKQEEVDKNLERAKLRRDQEIKKLNQEIKYVSVNDDETSLREFNQRDKNFKNNHSNKLSNRNNTNNRSINNNSRKNDDQLETGSRQNSRYHGSLNPSHSSQPFFESSQVNDKPDKAIQNQSSINSRQNFQTQPNFQNQSHRYHQPSNSQSNAKAPGPNARYQNRKSDSNQSGESRPQSEQKKSLKQLSHNVPEIESKLQLLGSKKLPTQTNQTQSQSHSEQKKTEMDPRSTNNENAEPKQNAWNRNESNQDSQSKQAQNKQEPKSKYQQRSNQSYRNARRRYEDNYEEDYDEDYDDYTEEDDEQFSQNNSNRTASGPAFSRRPNSSNFPQSYKRGSNRRSNDYYEMDSKNQYFQFPNRYYNYEYNYPKSFSANYNFRAGNSRNSAYPSANKVFYNSNTKNSKEPKEPMNRSRDQTSMTKHSEHTDAEMHDEWETASDTSLRHQVKKLDESKQNVNRDAPKPKNQSQKQFNNKKSNNQKEFKSRKAPSATNPNPNDPRYTAKYWSDNSKNDKTNEPKNQENRTKTNAQSKNQNQSRVNLQVYRVDKIVADDPEAIKEALKNQNIKEKPVNKTNPLSGIDLNNRAGVVIVDFIPESDDILVADENSAEDEEKDDDDGFQKVKTKRDKKAEKLKAQAEAAAAAAVKVNSVHASKRKETRSSKKTMPKSEPKAGKVSKASIMNNIQTWKNDMAKSGGKTVSQIVKSAPAKSTAKAEPRTRSLPDDLKKKTNAWEIKTETNAKLENFVAEKKPIVNEIKPSENAKTKDEAKDIVLTKQETLQPGQKNICTVKPTKQVSQPLSVEAKTNTNASVSNSIQNSGSGVVSPSNNQQDGQSMNKFYDKIMINQSSSAAVAASAAAAAATVVAVTVTSIQQQQISNAEQTEQNVIKQSNSSSSIQNQSGSNVMSNQTESQTNSAEMSQMAPSQTNYNFAPGSTTTSQTSLISSPSQANSQLSATSLIHSLSINHSMPPPYMQQNMQPMFQPMVQPFMSQSRPMVAQPPQPQPPQSQSANAIIQNQQNKNSFNSLFDLNLGEFNGKEGMFYAHGPPHPQNYLAQMPPHQPPMSHMQAQTINPYQNGFDHNQFFNPKILNNKPNGAYVQPPPQMPSNQFGAINSNQVKSQFSQNTPNQLINPIHQYSKQDFAYFNNQIAPGQSFGHSQASNQPTPAPNANNLGYFMSQIGNLNANQFQAQAHASASAQQSVFNMNHGQLSNNQLFGLGYGQQQQSSQFNLSNLIQTPQNQPQPNQTSSHRQTPLSVPSSPFIQNENHQDNGFMKQQNGFEVNYKPQQPSQTNYMRNSANLSSNKQMFSSLDENQPNKLLNQSNAYYRGIDQPIQNHFNQIGQIPPQQQPPLLPNPPSLMHNQMPPNQIQAPNMSNKMNFNKPTNMARYPNVYQNQNRPQLQSAPYNQNYNNRRSYPNQSNYQNNGKKMPCIDAKVVQKNIDLVKQAKQDGTQSGQTVQSQTRGSTPNTNEDKNECNANVI